MLNRGTCETCLIDYTKSLGNIYENISQACRAKGKSYRDTRLGELVHSIEIEHAPEHKVIYKSEPAGEKHEEGKTTDEQLPSRASSCEATTLSRG
jgi:hypothetical protein